MSSGIDLEYLRKQMYHYRKGNLPLPKEYVELHRRAAEDSIDDMLAHVGPGSRALHTEMVSDGWFDGMYVLRVVVETRHGEFRDIRWSDSNGGSWFQKGIGSTLLFIPENNPGRI